MAQCLTNCCQENQISKAELDRFTDKIENLVNDEKGKYIFREYLEEAKRNDALDCLHLYELLSKLLLTKPIPPKSVKEIKVKARDIDDLDYVVFKELEKEYKKGTLDETSISSCKHKVLRVHVMKVNYDDFKKELLKKYANVAI